MAGSPLLTTIYSVVCALLVVPIILIVCLWFLHNWWFRRVIAEARKVPPSVPTHPILGHIDQFISCSKDRQRAFRELTSNGEKNTTCIWFGPHPGFVVNKAETIQAVISGSKTIKSELYRLLHFAMGNGLITATEDIHSKTRRYIEPIFQPRNLQHLMPAFNMSSRHLVHDLSGHLGEEYVNVIIYVKKISLSNIACLIFGSEVISYIDQEKLIGLLKLTKRVGILVFRRFLRPWTWFDSIFNYLMKDDIDAVLMHFRQFAEDAIKAADSTRRQLRQTDSNHVKCESTPDKNDEMAPALSLVDAFKVLKKDYPEFTDEHLRHEMRTLILAGEDTTSIITSSLLLSLAGNPDVQDRLFQEITSVMGSCTKDVTTQDLQNMPFLDQVYKETLRKFTVVPIFFREAKEDIILSDCTIPAGATIIINLLGLHYTPSEFPEPHKFDPERFSPDRVANMKRFSYLPFSAGSRICIGPIYAGMLVKTAVIHVLRRFRLTTQMDTNRLTYSMGVVLISKEGYKTKLYNRSWC